LIDRGYGEVLDFLSSRYRTENIITNPPFRLAAQFVEKALASSTRKVAMFLRLCFLEGQSRYSLFQNTPLATVYVFSRRVTFYGAGSPFAFAWFVWDHAYRGEPKIRWIE
jgi:hypothetical protein